MRVFSEKPLEERPTQIMKAVNWPSALEEQPTQPLRINQRGRWLLSGLCLLLALVILAALLGQSALRQWISPQVATNSALGSLLHPKTVVVRSSTITSTVGLFMQTMLHKQWPAMWSMLAPDAQHLWQNEDDFTHFEQAKFGALTLGSYTVGQALLSHPWLDPDTTKIYSSAATVQVSLQATAPPGLLTGPSNQALHQGLFQHSRCALIQDHKQMWKVLVAGPADLDAPVLATATPPVSHLILPIFMYHHISSLPIHNPLDYSLTVTTTDFDAQLSWLQQQGYQSITMTELFDTFYDGKALPSKPMMLTFDDGYADVYTYALPALIAHHYRGVFYIISGLIGGNYMTWDQVRTLARFGMQIASHTVHHVNIGQPPDGLTTQEELATSKTTLEAELDEPIQFFCYPSGEPFDHDSLAERQIVLRDLFVDGYLSATLDPTVLNSALQNSQWPYQLPRIRVSGGESLEAFMGTLTFTLQADAQRLANGIYLAAIPPPESTPPHPLSHPPTHKKAHKK